MQHPGKEGEGAEIKIPEAGGGRGAGGEEDGSRPRTEGPVATPGLYMLLLFVVFQKKLKTKMSKQTQKKASSQSAFSHEKNPQNLLLKKGRKKKNTRQEKK